MPVCFHAHQISVAREAWGLIVTLRGDSTDEMDYYLMLQRKTHFTEQDTKLGMADVYIEYCGQGMSWYGNIDSFQLLTASVEVQMSDAAAAEKENDGKVVVSFEAEQRARLQSAFREVFEGRAYYSE